MPERLIGHTLGKYRVESLLGIGGFAWVYAALDPDLDILVALKVLKPQYAGNAEFEERFRREASTAAKLKHPNIIKIYTVGTEQHAVYFAMDLYTQKLTQQISVMGVLPEPAVLKLALDVSSALGFAHRQGVVHRDIKTDNILFDDHGNAIVADFGIARAAAGYAEQTGTNVIMGTPQFFAPEQARAQKIDPRADIYSLGVTLFVAATGELPFSGTDWYEIARKHVEEKPPAPTSLNPAISPDMERIILKCMEKDRENRYATADLLYSDLESVARKRAGEDNATTILVSTPVTGRYLAIKPASPKKTSKAVAALVFLGAIAAATGTYLGLDRINAAPNPVVASNDPQGGGNSAQPGGGGGAGSSGGSAGGGGSQTNTSGGVSTEPPSRTVIVNAPEATILLDGVEVGIGTWQSDTLPPGKYRIAAELPVSRACKWGRDSTVLIYDGASPPPIVINLRYCGYASISATKGDGGEALDARILVTSDGVSLHDDRLPMSGPITLPVGTHQFSITATRCFTFNDSLVVVKDTTTNRKIAMTCDGRRPVP